MANDDRNRPAAPRPPTPGEPIKVRELRFDREHHFPLTSRSMRRSLVAGERGTGEVLEIHYEPWCRHHRVRELGDKGEIKSEFCVPESWALHVPEV